MSTRRFQWPSPAMIVASLALMIALGGTSYAAATLAKNSVGSPQLKSNAVTTAKIKSHTIATSDLSSKTTKALKGATGAPGTALAYANFNAAGALDGNNLNLDGVAVAMPQAGVYCMSAIKVSVSNIIVSIDAVGSDLGATVQGTVGGLDLCPAGTQAEVQTFNQAGARAPQPFYIALN